MWSFSRVVFLELMGRVSRSFIFASLGLSALAALGACSFTPLYGNAANGQKLAVAYTDPSSRTEQIIYQQLALRLGQSAGPSAPLIAISSSTSNRTIGRSATGLPISTAEVTVTAKAKVTQNDPDSADGIKTLYLVTRSASATYTTNGQRLADQQALNDATSRAALAVGDTLSLLIRAKLSQ